MSGFICVSIDKAIKQILQINNPVRCKDELKSLQDLVTRMEAITRQIQHYRLVISWKEENNMSGSVKDWVKSFNEWVNKLDELLQKASEKAQQCKMSTNQAILRDQLNTRITDLTRHLTSMSSLVDNARTGGTVASARYITPGWETVTATSYLTPGGQSVRDTLAPLTSSATISQAARFATSATARMKLMDEPLVVGQDSVLSDLERLVTADEHPKFIGVLGEAGSGKTLLLKRLFNSEQVRKRFENGLLLWLTVSQSPSFPSLRNQLLTQIAIQNNVDVVKNIKEQHVEIWIAVQNNVDVIKNVNEAEVKTWLKKALQQSSGFVLFLDDMWERGAREFFQEFLDDILQTVSNHSNSKVIVSSRVEGALSNMETTIRIGNLNEHTSWELFCYHAFPYNKRNPPAKKEGKLLCHLCQGLPLALKVVGKAMAGNTHPKQWRWALQRLSNTNSVYDCRLRFSFEALGNEGVNMQCCFLYIASASSEGEILFARHVIMLWAGEGLLSGKMVQEDGYDPFEMGWSYLKFFADRFLIEPLIRYYDGRVVCFRIHDKLRELAIQIAEEEENFYCPVQRKQELKENDRPGSTRFFLSQKEFSLHQSFRAPQCLSLSMSESSALTKIPKEVIHNMRSLKFLDLSGTAVESLPESLGNLTQLVCLRLLGMPIKTLPASFTTLENLQILDLSSSGITELPSGFHMLKSLRYLGLSQCKDLQYLPHSISQITSLQYLLMIDCNSLWTNAKWNKGKKVAHIADLGKLTQLKRLELQNNGETIDDNTLGKMAEMDTLRLTLTKMEKLPNDIGKISKLKRLALNCSRLPKMEFIDPENKKIIDFQTLFPSLSYLVLFKCDMLVELPNLHNLKNLQRLEIIACRKLRTLPDEFGGGTGAFSLLEIFSLVRLEKLEKLPEIKEGAMPKLQIFTIMECPALKILPKSYLKLTKIRIYSCPTAVENWEGKEEATKVLKMSIRTTEEIKNRYFQLCVKHGSWIYNDFWCNEFFLFLGGLNSFL